MTRPLTQLPKAHLHLHLDGSFPCEAVERVAARNGAPVARPGTFATVWEFFDAYLTVPAALRSLDDLAELCAALVASEAAQGVVYAEPGVEPDLYPHLGPPAAVLDTMTGALAAASALHGIEVGVMVVVNTDTGADRALDGARLAVRAASAGQAVTAFGLACFDEPEDWHRFAPAVAAARGAGLRVVCHAGQTAGPASVRAALDALAPDRIAHGVRASEDPDLMARMAGEGVVCDVCPTSNVRLGVYPDHAHHPLGRLVGAGVPVSINADDEYWFGSAISDEYELARRHHGLDDPTLAAIAISSSAATGMSAATRARLDDGAERWLLPAHDHHAHDQPPLDQPPLDQLPLDQPSLKQKEQP